MRRRIRATAVALVSVLALALVGCSSGGDLLETNATAAPQFLAQSAQRTVEVATGRIELEITSDRGTITGSGSFDAPARRAELHVEATGDLPVSADVVAVDDGLYVRSELLSGLFGDDGHPWLRLDLDELGDLGKTLPGDDGLPAVDPDELTARLSEEGIVVTEVGGEDVRGARTTHYRALVPEREDLPELPPLVIDAWIDDAGLLRRLEVASERDPQVRVRAELFDLGATVDIQPPPPEEVADLGDLDDLLDRFTR